MYRDYATPVQQYAHSPQQQGGYHQHHHYPPAAGHTLPVASAAAAAARDRDRDRGGAGAPQPLIGAANASAPAAAGAAVVPMQIRPGPDGSYGAGATVSSPTGFRSSSSPSPMGMDPPPPPPALSLPTSGRISASAADMEAELNDLRRRLDNANTRVAEKDRRLRQALADQDALHARLVKSGGVPGVAAPAVGGEGAGAGAGAGEAAEEVVSLRAKLAHAHENLAKAEVWVDRLASELEATKGALQEARDARAVALANDSRRRAELQEANAALRARVAVLEASVGMGALEMVNTVQEKEAELRKARRETERLRTQLLSNAAWSATPTSMASGAAAAATAAASTSTPVSQRRATESAAPVSSDSDSDLELYVADNTHNNGARRLVTSRLRGATSSPSTPQSPSQPRTSTPTPAPTPTQPQSQSQSQSRKPRSGSTTSQLSEADRRALAEVAQAEANAAGGSSRRNRSRGGRGGTRHRSSPSASSPSSSSSSRRRTHSNGHHRARPRTDSKSSGRSGSQSPAVRGRRRGGTPSKSRRRGSAKSSGSRGNSAAADPAGPAGPAATNGDGVVAGGGELSMGAAARALKAITALRAKAKQHKQAHTAVGGGAGRRTKSSHTAGGALKTTNVEEMRSFLKSVPLFQSLSEKQLNKLANAIGHTTFEDGDIIIKQGDDGDMFYVIESGLVRIFKADDNATGPGLGKIVGRLSAGDFFGERALIKNDKRAASCVAASHVACVTLHRDVFTDVLSGVTSLLGDYAKIYDDDNAEVISLTHHMGQFHDTVLDDTMLGGQGRRLLDIMAAFSPELSADDVIERAVSYMYPLFNADRVGLFLVDENTNSLVLKVSKVQRGIRTPIAGLAGHVAMTGETLNIADVYDDPRFNPAFDKKTGYRSRSMLCVPVINPESAESTIMAVLQLINKNGDDVFDESDVQLATAVRFGLVCGVRVGAVRVGVGVGVGSCLCHGSLCSRSAFA